MHKHGEPNDTVYFIGGGTASVTNVMTDGRMVEVATVGNEGVVGMTVFLGGTISPGEAFIQVPDGDSQAMSADAFRKELNRHGPFYSLISRYSQALQILIMQSTACNSLHTVEERCSRWLLMTHDRVEGDEFRLTPEFLGYMLGARRPTVSLVLGILDKAGVISNGTKKNHCRRPSETRRNVLRVLWRREERVRPVIASIARQDLGIPNSFFVRNRTTFPSAGS